MAQANVIFGLACAFLLGIAIAGLHLSPLVLFIAVALLVMTGLFTGYWPLIFRIALPLLLFAGAFYYHAYFGLAASAKNYPQRTDSWRAIVVSDPQYRGGSVRMSAELESPFAGTAEIFLPSAFSIRYGDEFSAKNGTIVPATDERSLMQIRYPDAVKIGAHRASRVREILLALKSHMLGVIRTVLPSEPAAFLSGLLLGAQEDFSQALKNDMRTSGTTHLTALSGYNISILVLAISAVLTPFLNRRSRFLAIIAIISLFVAMVGAEASIVRAAIMGILALLAREVGRLYDFRNAIVLTALVMTAINPATLFSLGFQLSFISLLGIVYATPLCYRIFGVGRGKNTGIFREAAATTTAAQLAVMPLILGTFGTVSLSGFLANMFILPFVPITMFFGFFLMGFSAILPAMSALVVWIGELLLRYELGIIHAFARISLPVTINISPLIFGAGYYAIFIGTILYFKIYEKQKSA